MAVEELEVELGQPSDAEKRIKQLSGKVKEEAEAKTAAETARKEAEEGRAAAERERDFFAGFADTVVSNPQAKDHRDEIKAKVMGGYSLEDATYAVLGKAGKLNQRAEVDSPAGGSATTSVTQPTTKSPKEMKTDELREAVLDAVKKGDISWS